MDNTRILNSSETTLDLIKDSNADENAAAYGITASMNGHGSEIAAPSSQQQQLESRPGERKHIDDLLQKLVSVRTQTLESAHESKLRLRQHPLMPMLFDVLSEVKEKTKTASKCGIDDAVPAKADAQLIRLDNMLVAEGITDSKIPTSTASNTGNHLESTIEHQDYRKKLAVIRANFHEEITKYHRDCNMFTGHVVTLLRDQSAARPISNKEVDYAVSLVSNKLSDIQIQLKQQTCELVMSLRSRFLDARRKRRNFSKHASEILNSYFYSHLGNPYPSEEAKEDLAKQCDITVAQVSNWFGNKRIRYKKNIGKAQEEANLYAAKKAAATIAAAGSGSSSMAYHSAATSVSVTPPIMSPNTSSVGSQHDLMLSQLGAAYNYQGYPTDHFVYESR